MLRYLLGLDYYQNIPPEHCLSCFQSLLQLTWLSLWQITQHMCDFHCTTTLSFSECPFQRKSLIWTMKGKQKPDIFSWATLIYLFSWDFVVSLVTEYRLTMPEFSFWVFLSCKRIICLSAMRMAWRLKCILQSLYLETWSSIPQHWLVYLS